VAHNCFIFYFIGIRQEGSYVSDIVFIVYKGALYFEYAIAQSIIPDFATEGTKKSYSSILLAKTLVIKNKLSKLNEHIFRKT